MFACPGYNSVENCLRNELALGCQRCSLTICNLLSSLESLVLLSANQNYFLVVLRIIQCNYKSVDKAIVCTLQTKDIEK